jgi:hypothetical protein
VVTAGIGFCAETANERELALEGTVVTLCTLPPDVTLSNLYFPNSVFRLHVSNESPANRVFLHQHKPFAVCNGDELCFL